MSCILTAFQNYINIFYVYVYMLIYKYAFSEIRIIEWQNICKLSHIYRTKKKSAMHLLLLNTLSSRRASKIRQIVVHASNFVQEMKKHDMEHSKVHCAQMHIVRCMHIVHVQVLIISSLIVWNRTRPFRSFNMENGTENRKVKELTL